MESFKLFLLLALALTITSCTNNTKQSNFPILSFETSTSDIGSGSLINSTLLNSNPPSQSTQTASDELPSSQISEPLKAYLQVDDKMPQEMQASQDDTAKVFTITLNLSVGNHISIFDSNDIFYNDFDIDFDGTIKIAGEYIFTLKITNEVGMVYIIAPQQPIPNPTPKNTKVTVVYTNSEGWSSVYAYLWNYKSQISKVGWPGSKLTVSGKSGYNEDQYSIEVDYTQYDRIIFNDGQNRQTKDLIVGNATSGYYGRDGIFTMNTLDYGKVEYYTLMDTKNLQYNTTKSKKFSVYTPSSYNKNKKYGVLYMFDSQNLYAAANGAAPSSDSYGSWAVDVSVSNLIQRNEDGIIIVAIDNTDGYRDSELTMSKSFGNLTNLANNNSFYNGKLDELGNFIKETLMPFIQEHYSVDTSREHTGIAGSSSGGLAAYYLGLRDNNLYGYIGAFSPANGLFESSAWTRFYQSKNFSLGRPKIYVYCGKGDSLENMLLPAAEAIAPNLKYFGFSNDSIIENYDNKGTHSEDYWRIAFSEFLSKMID